MKSKTTLVIFLTFFAAGVIGGVAPSLVTSAPKTLETQLSSWSGAETSKAQINQELGTFAKLAQELKPSVVNISVVKVKHSRSLFQSPDAIPGASGQGSGVIISEDGKVLTNHHVVEGAKTISVKLSDGRELEAEVVGLDATTDLALLKLKDASSLPVARLGDSEKLAVGDWVMAIGNPFGLEATVTVGVLSGKGRVIGAGPYDDFLQTDASINPGNSGGPLFNTKGEVVGINTAIVPGGQGIGFSIPINLAREVSEQLSSQGKVVRGFIGAGIQPLTPALKTALKVPENTTGALIASVLDGGPAEQAGVRVSDIVVAVNNERISNDKALLLEVAKLPIGKETPITVWRAGSEQTLFVRIEERPSEMAANNPSSLPQESNNRHTLGLAVRDLQAAGMSGVLITKVLPGSAASSAGLRRGDIIRAVGEQPVSTTREFLEQVDHFQEEIALLVERQGYTNYVVVQP